MGNPPSLCRLGVLLVSGDVQGVLEHGNDQDLIINRFLEANGK